MANKSYRVYPNIPIVRRKFIVYFYTFRFTYTYTDTTLNCGGVSFSLQLNYSRDLAIAHYGGNRAN